VGELSTSSVKQVFSDHLASGGFPHLCNAQHDADVDADSDSEADFGTMDNATIESRVRQDDYQRIMNCGRAGNDTALLGSRELDLVHAWSHSWQDLDFDTLLRWLPATEESTVIPAPTLPPVLLASLSTMQRKAFDIVHAHTFGHLQEEQLLMVIVGTAGTGKSYLINAIRQLFKDQGCTSAVKITAPTGIAAANIRGSTIFSLLSLLSHTLSGERLHRLQTAMVGVCLLIIDEYSFLSIGTLEKLDDQLHRIFPHSTRPFGGVNIVLCGDPAQLAPVRALPLYAYRGSSASIAARFHRFNKVVELDQPFRQAGDDVVQTRFRSLLGRVSNCKATEDDWLWLQTRRPTCLSPEDNTLFDDGKYIVATNDLRKRINYERLSSFCPVLKIDECDADVRACDGDSGESLDHDDTQLFAVGAEVMLTNNLWTEASLVNGACGNIINIIKPDDDRNARIILVDFPKYSGPALSPNHPTVVPITQIRSGNTKGMPLTLAWAVTIHKAQGMTLDRVTIDLGRNEFASGMTFVALSRAKTFDGLRVHPFDLDRYQGIEKGKYVEARREEFARLRGLAATTAA
jgi:ATP-dependent DNA helicase PIF1